MKQPLRISLKIVAGLSAVAATAMALCLTPVDHRPYFQEAYYAQTIERLRAVWMSNQLVEGELRAGFGAVRLSPQVNAATDAPAQGQFRSLPLAGYGNRHGRPVQGVHDDVFVKAVALQVGDRLGVMIGADALIIPPEVTDRAMRRLEVESGLKRAQLYLSATHTHSSLGGWGEGLVAESFAGGFNPGVRIWFSDCIVAAVQQAMKDLRPAQLGQGSFMAPEFIRNRLVGPLGKVDPEFDYMLVKQETGRVAVLGVFGAHATVLSGDSMLFSADYPGYWQRAVEQATGGTALFLAGGVGSHSPVPGGNGFAGAEKMGQALAQKLIAHLAEVPMTNRMKFGIMGLEVSMPPLNVRVSDGVRLRPWLAGKLLHARHRSFIQAFRINNSVWMSSPCDFSGELALGIKDFLEVRGGKAVLTSFNGDYVGYVVPARYYHLNAYESRLMSFFGPSVPDYFDELMRGMAVDLIQK